MGRNYHRQRAPSVCTGGKTHEYKTLQNKPENVNIIRKLLKGDTHALV